MTFSDVLYGYVPHSDERRAEIWTAADFCLDANVLLNLYRYSEENIQEFLSLLKAIKNRLFVPHRVALEFARNRQSVICAQPNPHRELSENLKKLADGLPGKYPKHPDLGALEGLLFDAKKAIDQKCSSTTDRQGKLLHDDCILRDLLDIVNDNVGDPCSAGELAKEYERRKKEQIPPYCKTDDKEKGAEVAA